VADYFAAKMRARQQAAVTATSTAQPAESVPVPVPVPEPDPEAQDAPEGMRSVDGVVAGKKKDRKRKRKGAVEKAEMCDDDGTELHAESKKRKKKRKTE
jgi:hypothetical protein